MPPLPAPVDGRAPVTSGVAYALAAYGFWGLVPLYWKPIAYAPPAELTAHRVLWSVIAYGALVVWRRRLTEVRAVLRDRVARRMLALGGALLAVNWGTFIFTVSYGHVVQASLGYFITPLVSVLLGMTVLHERLRPIQWVAVALAAAGVVALSTRAGGFPWASFILAISFGLYGLVRKTVRAEPLAGSAVETILLAPLAAAYLVGTGLSGAARFPSMPPVHQALVVGTGFVTAIPLIWFAHAARRLPLSAMGFLQYVGPTIQLAIAVVIFGEPFTAAHGYGFGLIWAGLACFAADAYRAGRS